MKTKVQLLEELAQLENRLREIAKSRKIQLQDFKDQKADVVASMDEVLQELSEIKV